VNGPRPLHAIDTRPSLAVAPQTGETPLHWAAWRGKVRTIEELINMGADVEEQDDVNAPHQGIKAKGEEGLRLGMDWHGS